MKHVHNSAMVAHLWANKSQECARNQSGNFYFRGDTIYSYGSHFPIARHVQTKRGHAVLFTTRSYSVTTNGHKNVTASACSHLTVFNVQHPTDTDRRAQFREYRDRFRDVSRSFARARKNKPYLFAQLTDLVDEANRFAHFFGLRSRMAMPDNQDAMVAECKAIDKREREAKRRQNAKLRKQALETIAKWVSGELTTRCPFVGFSSRGLPIRLRVMGEELQTSLGAAVPVDHAIKAFRIMKRLRDNGETYKHNGHSVHLGAFTLDSMDGEGNVKVGCHTVAWSEIERIANQLGVNS